MVNQKINVGDRVRAVRLRKRDVVEGVVRRVNRLSLAIEMDDGQTCIVYPDAELVEPNPDAIQ